MEIAQTEFDAPGFIDRVRGAVDGALALYRPPTAHVVRIDAWFDAPWLGFSGKALGALGVAYRELTVPPFHPNRVREEACWVLDPATGVYRPAEASNGALHLRIPSEKNLHRRVAVLVPGAALFWYSGNSAGAQRGALMAYLPNADGTYWTWYAALAARIPRLGVHTPDGHRGGGVCGARAGGGRRARRLTRRCCRRAVCGVLAALALI